MGPKQFETNEHFHIAAARAYRQNNHFYFVCSLFCAVAAAAALFILFHIRYLPLLHRCRHRCKAFDTTATTMAYHTNITCTLHSTRIVWALTAVAVVAAETVSNNSNIYFSYLLYTASIVARHQRNAIKLYTAPHSRRSIFYLIVLELSRSFVRSKQGCDFIIRHARSTRNGLSILG